MMVLMRLCVKRIYVFKVSMLIIMIALASLVGGCILPKKHPDTTQTTKHGKMK